MKFSALTGIETSLHALTRLAWRNRLEPAMPKLARRLTDPEASRQDKMRALVDELHRPGIDHRPGIEWVDADDACLFVAAAAMSVGIRCRFVGVRFGQAWTCRLAYEVGDHWETIDCLRQSTEQRPDAVVMGPMPEEAVDDG